MVTALHVAATSGALERDLHDDVKARARATQLLAVFFEAARGNAALCSVAARTLVALVVRIEEVRSKRDDRKEWPYSRVRSASAAASVLMPLVERAPADARLACTRLLFAEALTAPSAPVAHTLVKLACDIPLLATDPRAELARLRGLFQLALQEFEAERNRKWSAALSLIRSSLESLTQLNVEKVALTEAGKLDLLKQLRDYRAERNRQLKTFQRDDF